MKLFNRYSGESFETLSSLLGELTVVKVAEIDEEHEISEQLDLIKVAIEKSRYDEFLVILVRQ